MVGVTLPGDGDDAELRPGSCTISVLILVSVVPDNFVGVTRVERILVEAFGVTVVLVLSDSYTIPSVILVLVVGLSDVEAVTVVLISGILVLAVEEAAVPAVDVFLGLDCTLLSIEARVLVLVVEVAGVVKYEVVL